MSGISTTAGGHPDQLVDLPGAGITGFQLNDGPLVRDNFQQHARAERTARANWTLSG